MLCECVHLVVYFCYCFLFFFFKQKTAYEMRISDWSSDVCSSDLSTSRADSSTVIGYPLLQRRHDKLGAGADALRPAQRRSLEARVEAHALRPMHVMVAKQGALPAAEGMEGHRHGPEEIGRAHV